MIVGTVDPDDIPVVHLPLAGSEWLAIIDTGFNGDLVLPDALRPLVHAQPWGQTISLLADGQSIVEDVFTVDFPFDGQVLRADATFVSSGQILIGTHLLQNHRLEIHFVNRTVHLERVA